MRIKLSKAIAVSASIVVSLMLLSSCGGLDPAKVPSPSALRGNVEFVGGSAAWPDTLVEQVLVVAFETKPVTSNEVLAAVLSGTAVISDTLPRFSDLATYTMEIPASPRRFEYIVVAMQNGSSILTDWLMLDVYAPTGDPEVPGSINLAQGDTVTINFSVDFQNLPPQPFE